MTTPTCATLLGGVYKGNGSSCLETNCLGDCCVGIVGDANMDGDPATVADIGDIINQLFGDGTPVKCLPEADADLSGQDHLPPLVPADLTVSDIGDIIDMLFGTGTTLPPCP